MNELARRAQWIRDRAHALNPEIPFGQPEVEPEVATKVVKAPARKKPTANEDVQTK